MPKRPRLVFTDIQRRTLLAIFKETKRPSKEMQATIAEQLGLKVSTVANFFMNARRRSLDKYTDEHSNNNDTLHENCELDSLNGDDMGEHPSHPGGGGIPPALMPILNSVTDLDTQQIVSVTPATIAASIMDHHQQHLQQLQMAAAASQQQQQQQHHHLQHLPLNPPATPVCSSNSI